MTRPRKHPTDLDLLNAVREQIAADPDISQTELRARIGGTTSVVGAAMHAVYVETGRTKPGDGSDLDPRFAPLIRVPQPAPPLDLRAAVPADLHEPVTEYLAGLNSALERVIDRVHKAALEAVQREQEAAKAAVEAAERRADRADEFVDSLRREVAEAGAETERVRAQAVATEGQQALEIARLTREGMDARTACAQLEASHREAVVERDTTRAELAATRQSAMEASRQLAVADVRIQELERSVADLGTRLRRAEDSAAAARAAETEARAAAAGALARFEVQDAILQKSVAEGRRRPAPRAARKGDEVG